MYQALGCNNMLKYAEQSDEVLLTVATADTHVQRVVVAEACIVDWYGSMGVVVT